MNFKFLILVCAFMPVFNLYAEEEINSVSNGSCWYSFDDMSIKVASFNEKSATKKSFDEINDDALLLIKKQLNFAQLTQLRPLEMSLHCGAYGSSFVLKYETNVGDLCLWMNTNPTKMIVRSLGHASKKDNSLCHGEKIGEFILGVADKEIVEGLKSEKFSNMVESIEYVAMETYKLKVKEAYFFKESEVEEYIRQSFDSKKLKYIERNDFRHPIGDVIKFK